MADSAGNRKRGTTGWQAVAGYVLGAGMAGAPAADRVLRYLALALELGVIAAFAAGHPYAAVWLLWTAIAVRGTDLVRNAKRNSRGLAQELERFYGTDYRASMIHELEEGIDGCIHRLTDEDERLRRVWTSRVDDPYAVLGLPHGASTTQIRHAYYRLVLKYHPDKVPGDHAKEMFLRVAKAYRAFCGLK
jgi:hypothetical protein